MTAIGLDLSLTATGIADTDGTTTTLKPPRGYSDVQRIGWLTNTIIDLCVSHVIDPQPFIAIEGFSYGSKGAAVYQIGGLGYAVRLAFHKQAVPYAVVPPSSLKKYATGKGNATKPDMRMALFKRADLDERDDNRVDAWWLRAMALDWLGEPVVAVPATHRVALDKVEWPARIEAAS